MTIQTDSTPLEAPKDHESCNVFKIFKLIAEKDHIEIVKKNINPVVTVMDMLKLNYLN
ncbi:MAG: hypothetical protein CM15mP22_0270 [Gammaproteobacteria bacterium]|nr:MAG: hypothetical protein CM15mP22_0270 [Gammaproteobacteria bacterium]